MGKRVIVGLLLAGSIIGLLAIEALLAHRAIGPLRSETLDPTLARWFVNGALTAIVVGTLTILATHELVRLAQARGYRPFGRTAQLFSTFLALAAYVSFNLPQQAEPAGESWALLWMAIALGFIFLLQAIFHRTHNAIENIAITVFIVFYAGGLAGFMTKLRMEVGGSTGVVVLLFSVFLVKMTDVGAYFVGKALGRHKMVPWLSPKKTWEGFAGGLVVTVVCSLLIGHWLHTAGIARFSEIHLPHLVSLTVLGVVLGLFSAAGDLCASLLKRDAAAKDSGQALPGLGGVLDVLDSPLLAAPVAWVFWARIVTLAQT